jgi:Domain of unknown function (DUF4263)
LIFCNSFEQTREFISKYLDRQKTHIDLIITNDSRDNSSDELKCSELCFLKNSITNSYSKNNFRICSIPTILYSNNETKLEFTQGFNSIIKKNNLGLHDFFITECESEIKDWRKMVYDDLEALEIKLDLLPNFVNTDFFRKYYLQKITSNAESYFANRTKVISTEFIKCPGPLNYDWIVLKDTSIEKAILEYANTYKNHVKYDRKNNERTILHDFFRSNKIILLRDAYTDLKYEENLYELNAKNSEECDFILRTEYPEFLKTTFFEVKKEDVQFYVKKNTKRPQISSEFVSHLEQLWGYKKYTLNPLHKIELESKLEYRTDNFDYVLLAGRLEEKEEMQEKFNDDIGRMYNGIKVTTYEELEEININYLDKFNRLKI